MKDIKDIILEHLLEINNGRCSITEASISAEDDPTVKEILTGLLDLHDDIQFRNEMAAEQFRHLGDREKRFRSAFENTGIGMVLADSSGAFNLANRAMCISSGYSEAELRSNTFFGIIHPGDLGKFRKLYERLFSLEIEEGFFRVETRYIHKNGSVIWAVLNVVLHAASDGDDVFTITHLEDITEQKFIEKKLKDSEKRLSLQISRTPLGVITWDTNFTVREWNPAAETIFKFSREEALGRHASHLIVPPEAHTEVEQAWKNLITNRSGNFSVNQNIRKDGVAITCEWHNTPLVDDDGNLFGVSSFVRDISARIKAEDALRASEERWKSLAAASFEGILIHDGGLILDANERLARKFHCDHSDLIGGRVLELIAEESRPHVQDKLLWQADGAYEAMACRKDGSKFPVEISSRGIPYKGMTQRAVVIRDLTEHKHAETALREARAGAEKALAELAYQKSALDQHSIVAITDRSGKITYANDKFCEISGYSRDQLIGKTHKIVDSGLHQGSFFEAMWETISSGRVWHGEIVNRSKDGALYWVDSTIVPFHGTDGEIEKYIGIRTDISQHKQAEQALRASEQLFHKAFSASPALIAIVDAQTTRMISVNDTWLNFMGMKRDDVIGKTVAETGFWANPDDRMDFISTLEREGSVRDREIKVRTKNGCVRDTLLAAEFVEFDSRKCVLAACLDIGERKRTENLEARLGRIVEGSHTEIYIFDGETLRFTQVNKGACDNLGYSSDELMMMTPVDLKPDIGLQEFKNLIMHLKDGGQEEFAFETLHQRKDGTTYDASLRVNYIHDETPPVFMTFVEDITDRKISEEAIRRSQKIEAIGQLTGGIAHDFNNLLGIILGNLDLLEEDIAFEPDLQPLVKTAQRAALRGSEMTKRLLAFSSKTTPNAESVNINESIVSIGPLIAGSLTPEIEIENILSGSLWNTLINEGDFEDSILNLAINARNAMPDGGKIIIKTENIVIGNEDHVAASSIRPGKYVHLSVSDTGTGISGDVIGKIFDPFFTTDGKGSGTGLGLSMVYGFIERSGGTITVESEEGQGATFHMYFPIDTSTEKIDAAISVGKIPLSKGRETILVVDDEPDLIDLAKGILSKLGYSVVTAENAAQATKILQESGHGEIDLLFSDIVMPGEMNGLELARTALVRDPDLRVLMATGYMQKIVDADSYVDITSRMLTKPYNKADLAKGVRAVLDGDAVEAKQI